MIHLHLIAITLFGVILRANAFSYKNAQNWGQKYRQCNGKNQSPILLQPDEMGFQPVGQQLQFKHFNKLPTNVTIKNTGHTVEVRANWSGKAPTVTGGPLHGDYVFEKNTFHWAEKAWTVKGADDPYVGYPSYILDMEMHMFFYKADLKSFEKAQTKKGGLAVFNIGLTTDFLKPEHFFDELEKNVHKVQAPNSEAVLHPFRLTNIIATPNYDFSFTFYDGSLDYPPCFESVTWFIYDSQCPITKKLVNEFRKIKLTDGDKSNLRPNQAQNDREPMTINKTSGKDD